MLVGLLLAIASPVLGDSFTLSNNHQVFVVSDPSEIPIGGAKLSFGYGWPPFDPISLVQIPIAYTDAGTSWTITAQNYESYGVTPDHWKIIEDGFLPLNSALPRSDFASYWHIQQVTYKGPILSHPFLWAAVDQGVRPELDANVRIDELRMTLHAIGTSEHRLPPHETGDGWWAEASFAIVGHTIPEPTTGVLVLAAASVMPLLRRRIQPKPSGQRQLSLWVPCSREA
jgi:hypothetical protein